MPRTTRIGTFWAILRPLMMSGSDHRDRERKPRPVYRTYHEHAADASSILAIKLTPFFEQNRAGYAGFGYADLSGTRPQLWKTGQSVCWHANRSSMRWPLQRSSPAAAQNRQIACCTNRGKLAG